MQADGHFFIIGYERTLIRLESSGKMFTFRVGNVKVTSKNISRSDVFKNVKNWKFEMTKMFLSSLLVE